MYRTVKTTDRAAVGASSGKTFILNNLLKMFVCFGEWKSFRINTNLLGNYDLNVGNSDVYDQNGSSGDTTNEDSTTYENERSSRMRLNSAPTTVDYQEQLSPSPSPSFPRVGGGQDHHRSDHKDHFHALWSNSSR